MTMVSRLSMQTVVFLAVYLSSTCARYHDFPQKPILKFADITDDFKPRDAAENTASYWQSQSMAALQRHLETSLRTGPAKNVILFLGDGMSIATVTAARIYLGQLNNQSGEEYQLSFEQFPFTGLSKTYCVDSQVADSACSGTAYLTGVKNNIQTLGVTADVTSKDWRAMQNPAFHTHSIIEWAQEAGKGTGIVTTCKVTDASPAAGYAHSAYRYWQNDQDILKDVPGAKGVQDIASQLIENNPGKGIKVILGGGRGNFIPQENQDEYSNNGLRGDGKDLIKVWKSQKEVANVSTSYITNRDQLLDLDVNTTDYLLGLFHHGHMDYHLHADSSLQPTLAEMTTLAIKMMQKEENGYFLFIEGGRIDHGHHENRAHLALDETVEFDKAIEIALNMTSQEDTLIVVTADHSHTMTINGYPRRGSDIFTTLMTTMDNLTYSTLSYANGPNNHRFELNSHEQHDISTDPREDPDYTFPTIHLLNYETHDGQDVGVYARGPSAHLLVGNYEQSLIPHVMGYAARIGPAAAIAPKVETLLTSSSYSVTPTLILVLFSVIILVKL
ncbi:membrane-bound alkaline phosphatase-like [Homalodisca vitripennis]|uniref:membrane-bound alkaline phosphatase-like n=1 Tax=Homalodisca vitripennis TaxID=197043 RepID=UPI001EEC3394|nr:membrane-bound alkaline phosphatase-like [Homalodisca vitripennis]KAG8305274.1 hypothetical protein J6590_072749 [Homalodisca vitripennis]